LSTGMKKLIFPGRKSKSSPKKRFWLANQKEVQMQQMHHCPKCKRKALPLPKPLSRQPAGTFTACENCGRTFVVAFIPGERKWLVKYVEQWRGRVMESPKPSVRPWSLTRAYLFSKGKHVTRVTLPPYPSSLLFSLLVEAKKWPGVLRYIP
jgi:ribosomal protein L37AE/L43A